MDTLSLVKIIEDIAPIELAASWDNSGVQVNSYSSKVSSVAVMLDPNFENIKQAIEDGASFILSHHPLLLSPKYLNKVDRYFDIVSLLIRSNVFLYSAHTSLDCSPVSGSRWLGHDLQLENIEPLEPSSFYTDSFKSGIGFWGNLPSPLSYDDFCNLFQSTSNIKNWRSCGKFPKTVSKIGCCPGSGSSFIATAESLKLDVYITGDLKYHDALDANCHILDVGHFSLEEEMMRRFSLILQDKLSVPVNFYSWEDPFLPWNNGTYIKN